MAIVIPNGSEIELLSKMLTGSTEDFELGLYFTGATLNQDTCFAGCSPDPELSNFIATFSGYAPKPILQGNWLPPFTDFTLPLNPAVILYNTEQVWTAGSEQDLQGYFLIGASSNLLMWAEDFESTITVTNGDTLRITPRLEFAGASIP